MDFLSLSHVRKSFGDTLAVDDVSLTVAEGEFFALLGPSGCGKTTLLRMIAGFARPDSGTLTLEGEDITNTPPHRRPTNLVFQSYAIFPHLTVFDNIAYGLRRQRLDKARLQETVAAMLATVRLEGFGTRRPDQLSGGQRQRVALARALVRRPQILLLDEPLGALDKRLREAMQIELRALQKKLGITFILVTHDQEEALSMSDRIAVMQAGKVLQVASPRDLYHRPASRDVAGFIGEMNFFHATVKGVGDSDVTLHAGLLGQRTLPRANLAQPVREGDTILLALRPEQIRFADKGVPGIIFASSFLGERSRYQVALEGRREPVTVAAPPGPARQGIVYLSWDADAPLGLPVS
jgi:spermidine/putrescine transport system ATP-binding protein/putrescine transport system ATP-binding protein